MRKQFLIPFCAVVAILAVVLIWLVTHKERMPKQLLEAQASNTNALAVGNSVRQNVAVRQMNSLADDPASAGQAEVITNEAAMNAKARAMIEAKNVPVDFYGRVIDQDSNSLSGAEISAWVRHWNTTWEIPHIIKQTDANGRFDINGLTGDGFSIESISKNGYESEPGQVNFGPTGGSLANPVVFKMWNTNIHEQLITGGKKLQIVPDGRPYMVNLAKGTIAESGNGDLKVWINYTNQAVRGQLYYWSCEIDVIKGGLLEEHLGTAMYEAPTDGYVPSFQFQGQLKGGQRGDIGERHFYLKLNNGQEYGRITIELFAPFNDQIPGLIRLSYAINPSGSRILR